MEVVEHFKYLGSLMESCDGVVGKVGCIGLLKHLGLLAVFMHA